MQSSKSLWNISYSFVIKTIEKCEFSIHIGEEYSLHDWNILDRYFISMQIMFRGICIHCKYLNAWFECNDIIISVYSNYPLDPNAKSSDTKGNTFSIRWFCIQFKRVMTVYENYDVIAFKACIQIFTVHKQKKRVNNRK